jgi:non-ribosomal peptide synthetase component E (peptide arylation enzyme)
VRKPWAIRTLPRSSADVRRIVTNLLKEHGPALRHVVLAAHADTRAVVTTSHAEAVDAMERRERTIASALPSMARVLVQAGLFDRRAVSALRVKQHVSGALLEASDERLRALDRTRALVVDAELTAVLIACSGPG